MSAVSTIQLRVLFVPDSIHWITGTIAAEIAANNEWIVPTICSSAILREALAGDSDIVDRIDLVHFLDPHCTDRLLPLFRGRVPCVTSIHHVVHQSTVDSNADGDLVTVGARQWYDHLVAAGVTPERLAILPYGVDTEVFRPPSAADRLRARRGASLPEDAYVVGFFGKASSDDRDRKGIDILSSGLKRLAQELTRLAVLLVGPGWGELGRNLSREGIRCSWVPFLADQRAVARHYQALDTYWVTARIEGGPVPLLEAMSSGVSCVTTPVGMAPEVVSDGDDGFLVEIGDVDSLVDRTRLLAADAALRRAMGEAARTRMLNGCSWSQTTRRVGELYQRADSRFRSRFGVAKAERRSADRTPTVDRGRYPLNALTPTLRRRVRMEEHLRWISQAGLASRATAIRLWCRAWLSNPLSLRPLTWLFHSVSPVHYHRLRRIAGRIRGHSEASKAPRVDSQ